MRMARNYAETTVGVIVFSQPHTNYRENENLLHNHFGRYRLGKSERYELSLEDVMRLTPRLNFLDESHEKEARAEAVVSVLKSFIMGGKYDK